MTGGDGINDESNKMSPLSIGLTSIEQTHTDQAISEKLLWGRLFNLQKLYQQPLGNPANPRNPASDLHGLHPA